MEGACDATVDDVLNGTGKVQTKTMLMEEELKRIPVKPLFLRPRNTAGHSKPMQS